MANNQFAPPSKEELAMFSPPTKDEMGSFGPPSHEELSSVGAAKSPGLMSQAVDFLAHSNSPFFKGAQYLMNGGAQQVAKVLDYPGGLVRTAAAGGAGVLTGHPDTVTSKDVSESFKGNAPSSAEYMGRLGIPEGPSVHVPYVDKTMSARDVGGFLSDAATNPLSYMGGFGAGEAVEGAGKSLYKSGLKKIDERLIEKGKTPLSDILLNEGAPPGTTKGILQKTGELADKYGAQREGLYNKATDLGASVDLGHPLPRVEAVIARMRDNPGLADKADALSDVLNRFKKAGRVDVGRLSNWKTDLTDALPASAFGENGSVRGWGKQFEQALAGDFKDAIVGAGNAAEPGLGEAINDVNSKWGSTISAAKPLELQVRRGNTINSITPIDAVLGVLHPGAEVAKKAADLSKLTAIRTGAGKGLMNAGQSGTIDPALRQALINMVSNKKKNSSNEIDQDNLRMAH